MLKWLRDNGCPWNETVCVNCVEYHNFDIFQWAIENACVWGDETYHIARTGKNKYGVKMNEKTDKKFLKYLDMKLKEKNH